MPNLTSVADWANSLGISRQQGYAAVKRCGIPMDDGKVDPEYATHLYHKHTRPRANGQRPGSLESGAQPAIPAGTGGPENRVANVPGYDTSRARREAAEAETAEVKLAELSGKFLLKTDVENSLFEVARALRDGLNNCARRIAAEVASLDSADDCEVIIERELLALLESMAQALDANLGADISEAVVP